MLSIPTARTSWSHRHRLRRHRYSKRSSVIVHHRRPELNCEVIMATSQLAPPTPSTGHGFFWSGLLLAVLGIVAYMAQFSMQHLTTPWYMPVLSTVGALLLL